MSRKRETHFLKIIYLFGILFDKNQKKKIKNIFNFKRCGSEKVNDASTVYNNTLYSYDGIYSMTNDNNYYNNINVRFIKRTTTSSKGRWKGIGKRMAQ